MKKDSHDERDDLQEMNTHDIYWFLKDAEMQLWIVFEDEEKKIIRAVVTTQIINYPQK